MLFVCGAEKKGDEKRDSNIIPARATGGHFLEETYFTGQIDQQSVFVTHPSDSQNLCRAFKENTKVYEIVSHDTVAHCLPSLETVSHRDMKICHMVLFKAKQGIVLHFYIILMVDFSREISINDENLDFLAEIKRKLELVMS